MAGQDLCSYVWSIKTTLDKKVTGKIEKNYFFSYYRLIVLSPMSKEYVVSIGFRPFKLIHQSQRRGCIAQMQKGNLWKI